MLEINSMASAQYAYHNLTSLTFDMSFKSLNHLLDALQEQAEWQPFQHCSSFGLKGAAAAAHTDQYRFSETAPSVAPLSAACHNADLSASASWKVKTQGCPVQLWYSLFYGFSGSALNSSLEPELAIKEFFGASIPASLRMYLCVTMLDQNDYHDPNMERWAVDASDRMVYCRSPVRLSHSAGRT